MKNGTKKKYLIIIIAEIILLCGLMFVWLQGKMVTSPEKAFKDIFGVDVEVCFRKTVNEVGGFPVDWVKIYESDVEPEKIVPYLREWTDERPDSYAHGTTKSLLEGISNGLFSVSDRTPGRLSSYRYYMAAYDIDTKKLYYLDVKI